MLWRVQIGLVTYSQLRDLKDLGSGQFSIAKSTTVTVDGADRRIAIKILKSSEDAIPEMKIKSRYVGVHKRPLDQPLSRTWCNRLRVQRRTLRIQHPHHNASAARTRRSSPRILRKYFILLLPAAFYMHRCPFFAFNVFRYLSPFRLPSHRCATLF